MEADHSARQQLTRHNHFVPQGYLRRWTNDGNHLFSYRTLVSHSSVPLWKLSSTRGVAFQRDLYSTFSGSKEADGLERWLAKEFEAPGMDAVQKVVDGARLKRQDWHNLIRLLAAQDVRTPRQFLESMQRWQSEMPELLERTARESLAEFTAAKRDGRQLPISTEPNAFSDVLRVTVDRNQSVVKSEVTLGRGLFAAQIRHALTTTVQALKEHDWQILEPANGHDWITSDHPVLKLNYYGASGYDFGGGWGRRNTNLIMPLTPEHLLHTQVGTRGRRREQLSVEGTTLFQRFLAERAHRAIFANKPMDWVGEVRTRIVDAAQYEGEQRAWQRWPIEQLASEIEAN
ncbi:MAG: DUF4238 domain-containing protein [Dehalococcoidia bacterium]